MILATKAALGSSSLTYRWVAVGASGNLATSDSATASSWTARTSSFGTTDILAVASNGFDMYVAVGDAGKLATSPDGITWTQRANPFGTNSIRTVYYANGIWVAAGNPTGGGILATATDPTGTWTSRTTGATSQIHNVHYGNGLWVLSSGVGNLRTAPDPTGTWTSRTNPISISGGACNLRWNPVQGIWTFGYAPIAASNQIISSTDGITWTARTLPNGTNTGSNFGAIVSNSSIIAMAYPTTAACDIASSTDGTAWTDRTPAITATGARGGAVDSSGFMVFANGTNIQTSTDGITWTSRTGPTFTPFNICHSSNA